MAIQRANVWCTQVSTHEHCITYDPWIAKGLSLFPTETPMIYTQFPPYKDDLPKYDVLGSGDAKPVTTHLFPRYRCMPKSLCISGVSQWRSSEEIALDWWLHSGVLGSHWARSRSLRQTMTDTIRPSVSNLASNHRTFFSYSLLPNGWSLNYWPWQGQTTRAPNF